MVVLLNSPVITSDGTFRYRTISVGEVRELVVAEGWISAISHPGTSEIISRELSIDCRPNPIIWHQFVGEKAIVFRALPHRGEAAARNCDQIESEGYSWGLLTRLA